MAQTGYTSLQLYSSVNPNTTPNPVNLLSAELALNIPDGKIYALDLGGNVELIAAKYGAYQFTATPCVINASAPAASTTLAVNQGNTVYYTSNNTTDFTLNITGTLAPATLDSLVNTNTVTTFTLYVTNGATPYYPNVIQIDGNTVTPKWSGGVAPSSGNANSVDKYEFKIIKTASATFTVFATQTKFA